MGEGVEKENQKNYVRTLDIQERKAHTKDTLFQ